MWGQTNLPNKYFYYIYIYHTNPQYKKIPEYEAIASRQFQHKYFNSTILHLSTPTNHAAMDTILQNLQATPNTSLALISLLFLVTIWFTNKFARKRNPYPPGPKGLPIVGNMGLAGQLNHRGLAALSKIYGGLFHLKMGSLHAVAVSTAEMAREVLQAQDNVFSNRPATIAISYLTYDRADMAFAHYGPFWRQMRKICVTKVFSRKRAGSWASVRDEIDSFIKAVDSSVGESTNIGQTVLGLTKNITYRAAFGSISQEGQGEFVKIMQEFSKLFGAFNIADFMPWLGWIHGQDFHKRLEKARGALDRFIDNIIDDHLEKRRNKNGKNSEEDEVDDDMVDELMEFYDEDGTKNDLKSSSVSITRDNIKALIMVRITKIKICFYIIFHTLFHP